MTPEERKAEAREKKRQRAANRARERLVSQQSSAEYEWEDYDEEDEDGSPRLLASRSFNYSESGDSHDLDAGGSSRDEVDTPLPKRRKRRRKKPIVEEEPVVVEENPEPETLAQRRVRKRAEAKALKMSEEEARLALLPPIVVEPPVEEEKPPSNTKAQERRERKLAKLRAAEEAQMALDEANNRSDHCSDDEAAPGLSRASSFQSFKNLFFSETSPEPPPSPSKKDGQKKKTKKRKTNETRRVKVQLPPYEQLGIYVPPSEDGTLRLCLQYMPNFGVVPGPGYFITGFDEDCIAKGLVRVGDKVAAIKDQSLEGMSLDEVMEYMDRDKSPKRGYTLCQIVREVPPVVDGVAEVVYPVGVTQQLIDEKAAEIATAYESKKKLKKVIRSWTKEFERHENRIVSEEDKLMAPEVFIPLQQLFGRIYTLEDEHDKLKVAFEREQAVASKQKA